MAAYIVAAGVLPLVVQYLLAIIVSTISLHRIGSPASASTFAAASNPLILSLVFFAALAGAFFAAGFFDDARFSEVCFRAVVFFVVVFFAAIVIPLS